jgi:hypothetical protein
MCFHGFLLFPGVPNTTAITQEMDQNYGPFQSKLCTNLQVLIDECLHIKKPMSLLPWIVGLVVFGWEDPETGCVVVGISSKIFPHAESKGVGKSWQV